MSRSRSISLSRRRTPSPYYYRKHSSIERSLSKERFVRKREKPDKERERHRQPSPSFPRSRSPRHRSRYSRSRSKEGRYESSNRNSPYVCPGDLRRQKFENPEKSRCLGVFGLNEYTSQYQIEKIFSEFGPIEQVRVVIDSKSRRSRGYCFVYFEQIEDAAVAKERCANLIIDNRRVRVDYSITQRAHTPTPGFYRGNQIRYNRERDDHRRNYRSSRSNRNGRGYRRSRSYSSRDRRHRN